MYSALVLTCTNLQQPELATQYRTHIEVVSQQMTTRTRTHAISHPSTLVLPNYACFPPLGYRSGRGALSLLALMATPQRDTILHLGDC